MSSPELNPRTRQEINQILENQGFDWSIQNVADQIAGESWLGSPVTVQAESSQESYLALKQREVRRLFSGFEAYLLNNAVDLDKAFIEVAKQTHFFNDGFRAFTINAYQNQENGRKQKVINIAVIEDHGHDQDVLEENYSIADDGTLYFHAERSDGSNPERYGYITANNTSNPEMVLKKTKMLIDYFNYLHSRWRVESQNDYLA